MVDTLHQAGTSEHMSTYHDATYLPTFEYLQDEPQPPHPELRPLVELLALAHLEPHPEPASLTERIHAVLVGEAQAGRLRYNSDEAHDASPAP